MLTHPHFFKALITVYSQWVVTTAVLAAGGTAKKDKDGRVRVNMLRKGNSFKY